MSATLSPEKHAAMMAWSLSVSDEEYDSIVCRSDAESAPPKTYSHPLRNSPVPCVLDLPSGTTIYTKTGGILYEAEWDNDTQTLTTPSGDPFLSISGWARYVRDKPINGWTVCYIVDAAGKKVMLSELRLTTPKTRA
jgi:hypothetical protein